MRHILLAAFLLISAASAPAAGRTRFLVTDHGAVGDGVTLNTPALQAEIDACASAGGGVLVVPKGVFLSGALYFKQGVDLEIEKNGVLKSTISMADFPPIYTRWEGVERYWTSAFLNFVGMSDVSVGGEGMIDGSGDAWSGFGKRPRPQYRGAPAPAALAPLPPVGDVYPSPLPTTATVSLAPDAAHLPILNAAGIRIQPGGRLSPPRAVVFQDCANVRVTGLHLRNEARWGVVFIYCKNVLASGLVIHAENYIPSSDGMDVDSCSNVLITSCDIVCNDDCISIKSGKDEDGRRVNLPSEDIVIEKTHFGYGQGGAAMGSEVSGGVRRVEVRDCTFDHGNWAPIRIKSQPSRGGVIEDITYRDIELDGVLRAFEFDMAWNMRINNPNALRLPTLTRRIRLINVHGTARDGGVIRGLPDGFIDGVTFDKCVVSADKGLVIQDARNVDTAGLALTAKDGPPITRR
jgi:exo-poly-alpha-galacturonosidase